MQKSFYSGKKNVFVFSNKSIGVFIFHSLDSTALLWMAIDWVYQHLQELHLMHFKTKYNFPGSHLGFFPILLHYRATIMCIVLDFLTPIECVWQAELKLHAELKIPQPWHVNSISDYCFTVQVGGRKTVAQPPHFYHSRLPIRKRPISWADIPNIPNGRFLFSIGLRTIYYQKYWNVHSHEL